MEVIVFVDIYRDPVEQVETPDLPTRLGAIIGLLCVIGVWWTFQAGIPGRRIGATEPLRVVVSALPLRVEDHRIALAELPDCGGEPAGIR